MNTKNQLVGPPYQYDDAGNRVYDGIHHCTYDAENRLIQVGGTLGTCSTAACYLYDAFGRHVEKITGSTKTDNVYGLSGNVVAEVNNVCASICWAVFYAYMNGQPVAEYKNLTTYFFHGDHLGSSRLVTGVNQAVVQNLDYLPFGELNSTDSGISTHKFTGDERDAETSFDHTQFRQYTSQLARWISPDPAGLLVADPSDPQSWNRYAYVLNDPMDYSDPLGLFLYNGSINNDIFLFGVDIGHIWPHLYDGGCFFGGPNWDADVGRGNSAGGGKPPCLAGAGPLAPRQSRCGNSSAGSGPRNSNSTYDRCISDFYNSFDGKVVQFLAPTSLIPGWNPGAWPNAKNWAEAIGTKMVVTNVAVAGSNAGKIVDYSLTAGTATTAASELSGVVSSALTVGSKIVPPVAAVATGKDVLAHAGCAVKSVLGFIPTLVP